MREALSVIIREMLNVIRSGCEGSAAVVRKTVRRYQGNRFFTPCHCPVSRLSHKAFLSPLRMTIGGKGVIVKERDSNGKNRDWVSLLVYKEVAGEAGRRILA